MDTIDSAPSSGVPSPTRVSARVAANRRNALKSTGPRTPAGKRRVALNTTRYNLCSDKAERELRTRGEDPREFRRLYRDLIAIFHPRDELAEAALEKLAWTWWEKARRVRNWVAAGPVRTPDLDARIQQLLLLQVGLMSQKHQWWIRRLSSSLHGPPASPAEVQRQIERRLFVFGAKPGRRSYGEGSGTQRLLRRVYKTYGPEAVEVLLDMQSELKNAKPASRRAAGARSGAPRPERSPRTMQAMNQSSGQEEGGSLHGQEPSPRPSM